MPDRITSLVPRPTPVTLGSRVFPVWEATLNDLADLQAWLDRRTPGGGEAFWEALEAAGDDEQARDKVLFEALEQVVEGVSADDDEGKQILFGTAEGYGAFLMISLSRGTPGVSEADVAAALCDDAFDPEQLGDVRRAFFGSDRASLIESLLGVGGRKVSGTTVSWGEVVYDVASDLGVPFREVYAMTLSEVRTARRGGKPRDSAFTGLTHGEAVALQRRISLARYGQTPEERFGPPVEFKTSAQVAAEEWARRGDLPGGTV